MFTFTFTEQELQTISKALSTLPFAEVYALMTKLQKEFQEQKQLKNEKK